MLLFRPPMLFMYQKRKKAALFVGPGSFHPLEHLTKQFLTYDSLILKKLNKEANEKADNILSLYDILQYVTWNINGSSYK